MKVQLNIPESRAEPSVWVRHEHVVGLALQPGSIEVGLHPWEMTRFTYDSGEMFLCRRHAQKWFRTNDLHFLSITISDVALNAACDGAGSELELHDESHLADERVGALVEAVNAERIAGFPNGRLFLDSVEQALAVALVNGYAVQSPSPRIYQGGLTPARLRKVTELVHTKIDGDLSLEEMADTVGLSTAHFSQMFRKSTGESPHRFVLRQRIELAKEMLGKPEARVLDVAVACGFKTQQHFARVFRQIAGASPTQYRHEVLP